ncbi:MAG: MOSC domain-containing protein [Stigonema ocellatum SAG 48.90 = DSM 106950]|nr:MOSC domain-containing protein [Stigonema ocellatum SAG 48.90 = DSM 106950]
MSKICVQELFIYPVKGLSPQKCDGARLQVGHGIRGDRAFALMYKEDTTYPDATTVPWMKKQNFAMQNDWSGLAALDCSYEETTSTLTVKRKGVELLVADTLSPTGRDRIATFFTGYLAGIYPTQSAKHPNRAPLQLVGEGLQTRYPDREAVHISLVSQATIDHLSELCGKLVDVRRFRPNIVLEGVPPWGEFDWVGQEMQLGSARIAITARINRCLNIHVNPETGEQDMALLSLLQKHFHHTQTGVLAQVITSGSVAIGDSVR